MASNSFDANFSPLAQDLTCAPVTMGALNDAVTIKLRGRACVGVGFTAIGVLTATFEGSLDGTNWFTLNAYPVVGGVALVTTAAANGNWFVPTAGLDSFRIRVSAYTSGSVVCACVASMSAAPYTTAQSATGLLKVSISGNTSVALDANNATAYPANMLAIGGKAASANPANATAGNNTAPFMDLAGRFVVTPVSPRALMGKTATTISATGATTIVAAQGAGVFADLTMLIITTAGAAIQTITVSDGTLSWIIDFPNAAIAPGTPLIIDFGDVPLPATTANTAWTANQSVATACHYLAVFANRLA